MNNLKITQKQIKQVYGYVSRENDIITMLRSFYYGSLSPNLNFVKITPSIYQIIAPNGVVKDDLFVIKSGKKKIKYSLISI